MNRAGDPVPEPEFPSETLATDPGSDPFFFVLFFLGILSVPNSSWFRCRKHSNSTNLTVCFL